MKAVLNVMLIAPPEELTKTGETYTMVYRELELPFMPFIGMQIMISSEILEDDPEVERFSQLYQIADVDGIFRIQNVTYHVNTQEVQMYAELGFRRLEALHAAVELYTTFDYGFSVL